ncbi:hypothetical protein V8C86DRAFT_3006025 [Haematococcus lacustris]
MQAKPTPGTQVNRVRAGSVRRVSVVSRPLEARISEGNHQPISATTLSRVEPHKVESSTPTNVASQLEEAYAKGFEAGQKAAASSQSEVLHDSVMRTAVKSLTWRVLSTATTMALALFLFKDSIAADAAVELGVVEFVSKYGLYFIHERLWAAIAFIL